MKIWFNDSTGGKPSSSQLSSFLLLLLLLLSLSSISACYCRRHHHDHHSYPIIITNFHWFFRVKTSSFQCENLETGHIFLQNKNKKMVWAIQSQQVKTILFQPKWQYVKNKVRVSSRSVVNEHHGENRKHLKNHMKIGREPFFVRLLQGIEHQLP